jgi:hypothetical protein
MEKEKLRQSSGCGKKSKNVNPPAFQSEKSVKKRICEENDQNSF